MSLLNPLIPTMKILLHTPIAWAATLTIALLIIVYVWFRILNFLHTLDWMGEEDYLRDADSIGLPDDFCSPNGKTEDNQNKKTYGR